MAKGLTKNNSVIKEAVQALQRRLSRHGRRCSRSSGYRSEEEFEEVNGISLVPEDVKEGHFAVLAISDEKPKRFIVSLRCLSNPTFLRLLELAEEEFGFQQNGAIAIPCRPSELEMIIGELRGEEDV